ncbi:MAG: hypothetical protein KKF41_08720 [Actinobacteria bacterium]|nr:hypothetical protein [Actinomycetota bacterium]MBU1942924.1 hypothetical protein [Actinomycetota bacterium]MBU2687655.1 hypothetical protein [Actinomycetota bacterium]
MEKVCTRCKKSYPATTEYFRQDRSSESGLTGWCKPCLSEYGREYRRTHREEINASKRRSRALDPEATLEKERAYQRAYRERKRGE